MKRFIFGVWLSVGLIFFGVNGSAICSELPGTSLEQQDRQEIRIGVMPFLVGKPDGSVDVATGKREWRGVFDQTQRTLTEDILGAKEFFKTGIKWLSAEELARVGVKRVFRTFPYAQFLR